MIVCNNQWLAAVVFLAAGSSVASGADQILAALEQMHTAVERGCDVTFDATYDFEGYGKARFKTRFAIFNSWIFVTQEAFKKNIDPRTALEQMIWRDGVRVTSNPRLKDGHITIIKSRNRMMESANWFLESCFLPYNEQQKKDAINSDYWLPFAIRNHRSEYIEVSEDIVDGISCEVLERLGHDRLWVCPKMNFAILKREFRTGPGNSVLEVSHFRDHREVEPGVWLPYSITRKLSGTPSWVPNGMDQNAPGSELSITVTSLRLGPVPEGLFSIPSRDGQYVYDMTDDREFEVAADPQSFLNLAVKEAVKEVASQQIRHRSWTWSVIATTATATIVTMALVWKFIKKTRTSS